MSAKKPHTSHLKLQTWEKVLNAKAKSVKNIESIYPLSPMQQGILFETQLNPESGMYIVQLSIHLKGKMDIPAMEKAWKAIVREYAALRTGFVYKGKAEPLQVVFREVDFAAEVLDWRNESESEQAELLRKKFEQNKQEGFNLIKPPLLRVSLIQQPNNEYQILVCNHHLILDGWSTPIFFHRLVEHYDAYQRGTTPKHEVAVPYSNYIQWIKQQDREEAEQFWKEYLKSIHDATPLPLQKSRKMDSAKLKQQFKTITKQLSASISSGLNRFGQKERITLNSTMQTAWGILLGKYGDRENVVFGGVTSGRQPDIEGSDRMVGILINTLPVKVECESDQTVAEAAQNLHQNDVAKRQFEYTALTDIQKWLDIRKNEDLFQTLFVMENYPIGSGSAGEEQELAILGIKGDEQPHYAISLACVPGEQITMQFTYDAYYYEDAEIEQLAAHYEKILENIANEGNLKISELDLLSQAEKEKLLVEWNDTQVDYPKEQCIHERFEAQAKKTPDTIALTFEEQQLTYRELDEKSTQLAKYLQAKGLKPDTLVGLCLERSLEMVIGILGILKAGGAYVPLDPEYPTDRLTYMLEDSRTPVILTQSRLVDKVTQLTGDMEPKAGSQPPQIIALDGEWANIEAVASDRPTLERLVGSRNMAYVIYTSGSTGKPKGVMLEHQALCNRIIWMQDMYDMRPSDRVLQKTPFSFDVSGWEFHWPLTVGARLVMALPEKHKDPDYLKNIIQQEQITVLHFVPSMLQAFLTARGVDQCHSIKKVICSGEALTMKQKELFFEQFQNQELHNLYGPTEAAIDVTYWECHKEDEHIPIGKPISNIQLHIIDKQKNLTPPGVPGELCIAGDGLARGYLNREELTAEKFIDNPFNPGTKLYRTGDLACWLPDGNIDYLGRIDNQVKIRGFRIELGEIENTISRYPGIGESVVIVKGQEDKQLIAYYVAEEGEQDEVDLDNLRDHLKSALPEYMVPALFVKLDEIPVTPNGKADRKALTAKDVQIQSTKEYVAPRNETEQKLAAIWQEVLQVEQVGAYDNFFELGGHSLLATLVIFHIQKQLEIEAELKDLFEYPTIETLAERLTGFKPSDKVNVPPLQIAERPEPMPMSYAQERLWFLDQLDSQARYNIPGVFQLKGCLNQEALVGSFRTMIERHEMLRTRFKQVTGEGVQVIVDDCEPAIQTIDLTGEAEKTQSEQLKQTIEEEVHAPFDLANGPLLRLTVIKRSQEEHILILNMHHIISDGWSMGVIVNEFNTLYEAYATGKQVTLPALPVQYADYTLWQRQLLSKERLDEQIEFWKQHLAGYSNVLELPTDFQRPAMQSGEGKRIGKRISQKLTEQLNELSRSKQSTLFMTTLAALYTLLRRYCRQEDICIGTPTANRSQPELEGLIGMFINTLALRICPEEQVTVEKLIEATKKELFTATAHQETPFEKLVDAVQPTRDMSRTPIFQVMLSHQPKSQEESKELAGLTFEPFEMEYNVAKFDLTFDIAEHQDHIEVKIEYNTDLFRQSTIERMLNHFEVILEAFVDNPTQKIDSIEMLTTNEKTTLLEWSDVRGAYAKDQCVHELFEAQVQKTPDRIAVVYEEQQLTYRELDAKSTQLAKYLQANGVVPDTLVAICVERSVDMLVGILGILKAGGAYVPLDPEYPMDRLTYMIQDSQAPIVLTQSRLGEKTTELMQGVENKVVFIDKDWTEIERIAGEQSVLKREVGPNHLAYVIYTSGSTGKPKGVLVQHDNVHRLFSCTDDYFHFDENDVWTLFHSFNFDFSVWEIWGALLYGGKLVVVPFFESRSPEDFFNLLVREKVTILNQTPTAFLSLSNVALNAKNGDDLSLRHVIFGGEALAIPKLKPWFDKYGDKQPELINMYGITETTVHVTYYPVSKADLESESSNIGVAIPDLSLYILDSAQNPVPVNVPGEMCVGGSGVVRGYLNRPELTEERFIENPFDPGTRLYRSGDLAKWLPDGNIEYLGRIDHQVKIRGFRIELGEIENNVGRYPGIGDVIILVKEQDSAKQLVAFFTAQKSESGEPIAIDVQDLRDHLKANLPDYMIPATFVQLDEMPMTPNGKVDRKQLLAQDIHVQSTTEYVAPRNEKEEAMAAIWQQVLQVEQAGVYDNFFELGGDSIISIQIVAKARQQGLGIAVQDIFQHQTIAALVEHCGNGPEIIAEQETLEGEAPLTPIQQWFFENSFKEQHHWNQSMFFTLRQSIKPEQLQEAVAALINHHDALRFCYRNENGTWTQRYNAKVHDDVFDYHDVSDLNQEKQRLEIEKLCQRTQAGLNLEQGPIIKMALFERGEKEQQSLFIAIHHLAIDGVSWRVLLEDFHAALQASIESRAVEFPKKTSSFRAWGEKLTDYAQSEKMRQEVDYWTDQNWNAVPKIPVDFKAMPPQNLESSAEQVSIELSKTETKQLLEEAGRAYQTQINDLLLSALAEASKEWTGFDSTAVMLEGHGREDLFEDLDINRTVGWFTSMFPLQLAAGKGLEETIMETKGRLQRVPQKGVGYGILKYMGESEAIRQIPKPELIFNYLGQVGGQSESSEGLFGSFENSNAPDHSSRAQRPGLIEINGSTRGQQLSMTFSYSRNIHKRKTVEEFAKGFEQALRKIITHCTDPDRVPMPVKDERWNKPLPVSLPQFPELLHLNDVTIGQPVFWIHSGSGGAQVYDVVAAKSQRPFYGIQARGLTDERLPLTGLQAMAAYYVHIIQTVQPEGPYDLGGYSLGGNLSYEVARQLQELGQEVSSIVMLDTPYVAAAQKEESMKSELLGVINIALQYTVMKTPEKMFDVLIRRDQVDATLDDEAFFRQLVRMGKERGMLKTEAQVRTMMDRMTRVSSAYQLSNYTVQPLSKPESVHCYYFRNKSGIFIGELAPYFTFKEVNENEKNPDYWKEWADRMSNFHILDAECSNHMVMLSEPKSLDSIHALCEPLYSERGLSPKRLDQLKKN